MKDVTAFRSTLNKGFQMRFANGYIISVQWGNSNYCERHDISPEATYRKTMEVDVWDSANAEVLIEDSSGQPVTNTFFPDAPSDGCVGHLTPDEVAKLINAVAVYPKEVLVA